MPDRPPPLERVRRPGPKGIPLELYRLPNPGWPPVLLLHGASAQHETFQLPRGRSLAETLWANGYDPWLLDWRGSNRLTKDAAWLAAARERLDFDHAAAEDVPWALARIREVRRAEEGRAPEVCVVGHCMGAGVLAQAVASGAVGRRDGLGRIVLLTLGLFYEPPLDGRLKSQDYVLDRLWAGRAVHEIDPRVPERDWPRELREIFRHWAPSLRPHPGAERPSTHELCNRLSLMYGTPYRERNLVPEIHGVRRVRFDRGRVEPGRGERLRGASGAVGFVTAVERESGAWRRGDAAGHLELSGATGAFAEGEDLVADDDAVVATHRRTVHETRAELHRQFGGIPLRMYLQGAQHVRRRWAAPFGSRRCEAWIGPDARERFLALPAVTLVTGARNQLWHRDSVDRMYEWLRRGAPRPGVAIRKEVLAEYGHQDLLWGQASDADVYPIVIDALGGPGRRTARRAVEHAGADAHTHEET